MKRFEVLDGSGPTQIEQVLSYTPRKPPGHVGTNDRGDRQRGRRHETAETGKEGTRHVARVRFF
jgi:hypothetical protein